jgi:prevent-host-death family protein
MNIEPEEFVSARDASRSLGKLIDRLEAGELAKAIIVDRNNPRAVVLSLERYIALSQQEASKGE